MFQFISTQQQLIQERIKNEQLQAQRLKDRSDLDYIAMMADIELETEEDLNDEQI